MPSTLMLLSNPHRPDPRVLLEARALREAGYDIKLIAWDREGRWVPEAREGPIDVLRLGPKCPARNAPKILARLPRFWLKALGAARKLDFDFVHAHDFDTLPLGMAISKLTGKPLLYDAHELYSKMVENDIGPLSKPMWSWERSCAGRADEVITVSDALASELAGGRTRRPRVVTTSQSTSALDGANIADVRGKYGLRGFVISYLGSLEPGRFVEEYISSFGPQDRVTLVVAGSGTLEGAVSKAALHNPALKYIGTVDADEAMRITWASDLVLAMMDPSNPNNVVGTPGKIINAMAVGRPVLTTEGLDISARIREANAGIVVPWDKGAVVEAVLKASANPEELKRMGKSGREFYDQKYSWERSKSELIKAYQALEARKP